MAKSDIEPRTGGACSRLDRPCAGNVSGLVSFRVRGDRSGHCGESCEPRAKKTKKKMKRTKKMNTEKNKKINTRLRVATWNVGTLKSRSAEVLETLSRRRIDICGVQEHRWKGGITANQVRTLKGKDCKYRFYYCAHESGFGGVGVLLAENWADKVIEVQRISDRILLLKLIIGKAILTFISVYAPQSNLPEALKELFYDQLQHAVAKVPASEILIPVGDWNGHVGTAAGVYQEAHGGHGFGSRNADGERILEFAIANGLKVGNTWYKKKDSHLITYSSGGHTTQLDYILYRKNFSRAVRNVKVIPNEECVQQHHLVVCDFSVHIPHVKKRKFTPRIRAWKLRDSDTASQFQEVFKAKVMTVTANDDADATSHVETVWSRLKGPMLDAATEVCGLSKNHKWRAETWWWNENVDKAIQEKRAWFKTYNALIKEGKNEEAKKAKAAYIVARRQAKREVYHAKSAAEKEKFARVSLNDASVFRIAKQMDRSNQDILGENCIRNDAGELAITDDDKLKAWVEHYARLLNVEFDWPKDMLPEIPPNDGPPPTISSDMIRKALSKMKNGKAAGPSGIIAEMLKATGEEGVELARELTEAVFSSGEIPADWEESYIQNLYKGKGEAIDRGNYRGLKLTDQVLKMVERVLESSIREMVNISGMQFAYVPGRGTTDAIFIVRQLQEKHIAANRQLYYAFVDLEKAFDRVPRKVLWWALRSLGVKEWAVRVIQGMYSNVRSRVRVNGLHSEEFGVKVGVHQGSVLSPLLFILVLEALGQGIRGQVQDQQGEHVKASQELFYADDLVLIADSLEECISKLETWKNGMECKGLRVNMKKTKVMVSGVGLDVLKDSGKYPCAVCRRGVGNNSIKCSQCKMWVHKKCSRISGPLKDDPDYVCPRCCGVARPIDGRPACQVDVNGTMLNVEPTFCYLGDMLSAGGGCDSAIAARCCAAWGRFRELLPVLTSRHLSPKIRGKVYNSCIRSTMLHGSETWGPNASDLHRLQRNDRAMIRWICGAKVRDRNSAALLQKLGIADITAVLSSRRLRWYGHVERAPPTSTINSVTKIDVSPIKKRGRPRKTWLECVKNDIKKFGLTGTDMHDREAWRAGVRRCLVLPTPVHSGNTDST